MLTQARAPKESARLSALVGALALQWALTPPQTSVLLALAEGRSRAEIAREGGITESTLNFHIREILRRSGAKRIEQVIAALLRHATRDDG